MSALFDIKAVKAEAEKEIRDAAVKKAKDALVNQMRVVERAKQVLRGEELKLADIERQIADGTLS